MPIRRFRPVGVVCWSGRWHSCPIITISVPTASSPCVLDAKFLAFLKLRSVEGSGRKEQELEVCTVSSASHVPCSYKTVHTVTADVLRAIASEGFCCRVASRGTAISCSAARVSLSQGLFGERQFRLEMVRDDPRWPGAL